MRWQSDDVVQSQDRILPLRNVIVVDEAYVYLNNKNLKAVERFVGTAKSSHKLEKALEGLEKGMGVLNLGEPSLVRVRQFWERK